MQCFIFSENTNQGLHSFEFFKFHDFLHDLFKFSKTLGLAVSFKNSNTFLVLEYFWPLTVQQTQTLASTKNVYRLHRLVTPSYFSVYTVLASSSAVTYLSSKTLIFHNFQRPTIKFLDFPGQEIEILKFHDFPGFPWPVQTLLINSSAGLLSKTSSSNF